MNDRPIECQCNKCKSAFKVMVSPEAENYFGGEDLNKDFATATSGGVFICPEQHQNDEDCVIGDAYEDEQIDPKRRAYIARLKTGIWHDAK